MGYISMRYYIGTEQECMQVDSIISENCGWPNNGTNNWANPKITASGDYVIPVPEGSHGFTAEQMQTGLERFNIVDTVEFPEVVDD